MGAVASQITSLMIVYSTVYSDADKKKISKLHVTGLCVGNSPGTGEFPAQRASYAENISMKHTLHFWPSRKGIHRSPNCRDTIENNVTKLCTITQGGLVPGEFPAQMASNAENVSIWWRRHDFV